MAPHLGCHAAPIFGPPTLVDIIIGFTIKFCAEKMVSHFLLAQSISKLVYLKKTSKITYFKSFFEPLPKNFLKILNHLMEVHVVSI